MLRPFDQVRVKQVVRPDADFKQLTQQIDMAFGGVVDAAQQHGLIADWDAMVNQVGDCLRGFGGDLLGAIKMRVEPDRMVFG